jgi:tRNA-specific 2-thiouridylase
VVTGHYAKTDVDPLTDLARLVRSRDPIKDQTYFLSKLSQQQVPQRIRFEDTFRSRVRAWVSLTSFRFFFVSLSLGKVASAMFPLGDYRKADVRELAESFDLPTKHRKDSQGVCFLGKLKCARLICREHCSRRSSFRS